MKPDVNCIFEIYQYSNLNTRCPLCSRCRTFLRWEVEQVLSEWVRVLKPKGKLILECPNLISACEEFLKDPEAGASPNQKGQKTMWVFYGDPRWRDPLMVHRWGYTPKSLAALLHNCGLTELKQEPAQFKLKEPRDMRITGIKP